MKANELSLLSLMKPDFLEKEILPKINIEIIDLTTLHFLRILLL